ncbi:helix-turn-helix transcriptional regulator [Marinobacter xestospongiae]|uniref:LuxR C-terminal-related transcriptional regulator n=1 Tax=Marinobacter xestospongiae TaxID=994319 RepID=A0ABU3VV17_9GAMM|nr:LuxR C-terminal-related transcriptional regulator [Marinobacter xestospongiae]MDV2078005.1 LuxR C-terminal-related transcriptional regulator [Marinobacter xestospongiae]
MHRSPDFQSHLELIYQAIGSPGRWQALIETLKLDINASMGLFSLEDKHTGKPLHILSSGFDNRDLETYSEHFYDMDIWSKRLFEIERPQFVTSDEMMSLRDFKRTEVYNDYARPLDIHHATGNYLITEGNAVLRVAFQRSQSQGPFQTAETDHLTQLRPHIQRAITIQGDLDRSHSSEHHHKALLDNLGNAALVLDVHGTILYHNDAADRLVGSGSDLIAVRGRLHPRNPDLRSQFGLALREVTQQLQPVRYVHTPDFRLILELSPFQWRQSLLGVPIATSMCALVKIKGRHPAPVEAIQRLQLAFGLSGREANVGYWLTRGYTPERIAEQENRTVHTVRSQIKSMTRKLQAAGQMELALVLSQVLS